MSSLLPPEWSVVYAQATRRPFFDLQIGNQVVRLPGLPAQISALPGGLLVVPGGAFIAPTSANGPVLVQRDGRGGSKLTYMGGGGTRPGSPRLVAEALLATTPRPAKPKFVATKPPEPVPTPEPAPEPAVVAVEEEPPVKPKPKRSSRAKKKSDG